MWLINKKRIGIDNGTIKEIFELTKEGIKKTTEASKLNEHSFKITIEPDSPADMEDISSIRKIEVDNGTIKEIFKITEKGIKKTTTASKLNTFEDDETSPVELLTINCCMNQIHGFGKARNGDLIFPMTIIG